MTAAPVTSRAHRPHDASVRVPSDERCVNCGARIDTAYCPTCGEQRAADRHYSLVHFGEEVLEAFTHADGRLVRTLGTLIARPGELTVAYMAGQRRRYLAPLQLFFILNLIFFLVGESRRAMHVFDTPLALQMNAQFYSGLVRPLVLARVAARHIPLASYAEHFDHAATASAHSLVILMVPLVALATALFTLPRRSYAVRHVVFGLHALAAMMFLLLAVWLASITVALAAFAAGVHLIISDAEFSTVLALAFGAYLARALRVAYDERAGSALVRAVLLTLSFLPILTAYRFVLFYVTFYTT